MNIKIIEQAKKKVAFESPAKSNATRQESIPSLDSSFIDDVSINAGI
jgi:hypothetical protein